MLKNTTGNILPARFQSPRARRAAGSRLQHRQSNPLSPHKTSASIGLVYPIASRSTVAKHPARDFAIFSTSLTHHVSCCRHIYKSSRY
ncbi:hypothetical protein KCP77_10665 [Salmonella enterica subsp. enterica]|nr:hypothetical protein KCP77_10665 [Salmonella enterica subsp. enterica]